MPLLGPFGGIVALLVALLVTAGLHVASGATAGPWRGDFETGNLSQWTAAQAKEQSRITVQSNVVRQGRYAARFEVRPGDSNVAGSGSGERAEVFISPSTTNGVEGQEQYWAWSTFFPADFDAPRVGSWNAFTQFHHAGPVGQANIYFAVSEMKWLTLRVFGGSFEKPARSDFVLARLQPGRWYDFVFHVKWSSSARMGFVEVWVNRLRVVRRTRAATLYAGRAVYLKQGYYRRGYEGTTVVYHDGVRSGSTLRDVVSWGPGRIPQ
jgi:hypothetical protein